MEADGGIDEAIKLAIAEGVRAGVHRTAARMNPTTAGTWAGFAEVHHQRAATLLASAVQRLGMEDAEPEARGEW